MKKLLSALVLLLVIAAGGTALYLFQKQNRGGAAARSVAEFLPADTQLLLSLPDLNGMLNDWKTTDLYKIWSEPEIQGFLARPLSKLPPHPELDAAVSAIIRLSPTNCFIAVTPSDDKTNQPRVIAGFDFKGEPAEVEQLLSGAKDALRKKNPAGKADLIEYKGHPIETFDGEGDGTEFYAAVFLGHRYLVANNLALLESTIDRCASSETSVSQPGNLDKEADFQTVLAKLPPQYATLIFARPQAALHRLLDLATASGQPLDESRRAELEKLKAFGATTRFENGKLRDSFYYLAPGAAHDAPKLSMGALPLTSPNTLIYVAAILELPTQVDLRGGPLPPGTPVSGLLKSLQEFGAMLRDHNVTLERFTKAFGNEFSLNLDWPPDHAQPTLLFTVDVRDGTLAGKFVDDLTNTLSAEAAWSVSQVDGLTFHTMSGVRGAFVSPTLTLTNKHFVFGLNPPEVREAAQREVSGGANFTANEAYQKTVAQVPTPNASFAYLDSPAFFERLYGTLRNFALFGALFYPHIDDYVDLTKLPSTKTISKHLSPTVFSQKSDDQGSRFESVGTVTVGQAGVVLVGGAAAGSFPLLQSQLGGKASTPARQSVAPITPAASPAFVPPTPSPQTDDNK